MDTPATPGVEVASPSTLQDEVESVNKSSDNGPIVSGTNDAAELDEHTSSVDEPTSPTASSSLVNALPSINVMAGSDGNTSATTTPESLPSSTVPIPWSTPNTPILQSWSGYRDFDTERAKEAKLPTAVLLYQSVSFLARGKPLSEGEQPGNASHEEIHLADWTREPELYDRPVEDFVCTPITNIPSPVEVSAMEQFRQNAEKEALQWALKKHYNSEVNGDKSEWIKKWKNERTVKMAIIPASTLKVPKFDAAVVTSSQDKQAAKVAMVPASTLKVPKFGAAFAISILFGAKSGSSSVFDGTGTSMSKYACHECLKPGHNFSDCPKLLKERTVGRRPETPARHLPRTPNACHLCGGTGHYANNCHMPDTRTCNRCKTIGHTARKCPTKNRNRPSGSLLSSGNGASMAPPNTPDSPMPDAPFCPSANTTSAWPSTPKRKDTEPTNTPDSKRKVSKSSIVSPSKRGKAEDSSSEKRICPEYARTGSCSLQQYPLCRLAHPVHGVTSMADAYADAS